MLQADSEAAARDATKLVVDARARHFYDPRRRVGEAVARSIGAPGEVAWDMYLAYHPETVWRAGAPPAPMDWRHQLRDPGRDWADPTRLAWAEDLPPALRRMTAALLAG